VAVSEELMALVRQGFALRLSGLHGQAHWRRVHANGSRLASINGADLEVVELFAYLHDSKRQDDGRDRDHGRRAAAFIRGLRGDGIDLPPERFDLLVHAVAYHADGLTDGDVTVQTCWDADRLDLGRIGIRPDPKHLCTEAAKDPQMIEWAWRRSRRG